ncbi:hypothetical protein LC1Hm_2625 [Halomicrobium sp. LC1Hm]|nr:hypothetical protein LC1Hm_2625 [Halomicrobium sp. LC1Hm]
MARGCRHETERRRWFDRVRKRLDVKRPADGMTSGQLRRSLSLPPLISVVIASSSTRSELVDNVCLRTSIQYHTGHYFIH